MQCGVVVAGRLGSRSRPFCTFRDLFKQHEVITTAALFVSVSPSALVVTFIIQCYLLVELCCWLICTTDRVEASIDNGSCCYIRGQLGGNIIW